MAQIQELKEEMKGVISQIVTQKDNRNALKVKKGDLTATIKELKVRIKDTKKSGGDTLTLKDELTRLKLLKKDKAVEISNVKGEITKLRNKKVELRNKIKSIKTKD